VYFPLLSGLCVPPTISASIFPLSIAWEQPIVPVCLNCNGRAIGNFGQKERAAFGGRPPVDRDAGASRRWGYLRDGDGCGKVPGEWASGPVKYEVDGTGGRALVFITAPALRPLAHSPTTPRVGVRCADGAWNDRGWSALPRATGLRNATRSNAGPRSPVRSANRSGSAGCRSGSSARRPGRG